MIYINESIDTKGGRIVFYTHLTSTFLLKVGVFYTKGFIFSLVLIYILQICFKYGEMLKLVKSIGTKISETIVDEVFTQEAVRFGIIWMIFWILEILLKKYLLYITAGVNISLVKFALWCFVTSLYFFTLLGVSGDGKSFCIRLKKF